MTSAAPLSLHPDNPRYFLFRGSPIIIITSGEHYGAVLNADFDFTRYLDTLARDHLNGTRLWAGTYAETAGNFNIAANTLDPAPGRFLSPWARSDESGYADGGNKFDLTRYDPAFFARLKAFVAAASARGVIVEVNLFCPMYEESMWALCPMNARNNINHLGDLPRDAPLTLDRSGGLLAVQEALVRKFAAELREFDNVTFELVNEPYQSKPPVPDDWQRHLTDVLATAMRDWPHPFLISWNIANGRKRITAPHPAVSLYNFHYATPPDAIALNASLRLPIGDNETGFRGTADLAYRTEAWDFILAGGALFNHLDYSFTVGHEDGTYVYPEKTPGGGNATLRRQFSILRDFIYGFDFVHLHPDDTVVQNRSTLPAGMSVRALIREGEAYAIYMRTRPAENRGPKPEVSTRGTPTPSLSSELSTPNSQPSDPPSLNSSDAQPSAASSQSSTISPPSSDLRLPSSAPQSPVASPLSPVTLTLSLPPGRYTATWLNCTTGQSSAATNFESTGTVTLTAPEFSDDIALKILKR